jgi:hypothetical protein
MKDYVHLLRQRREHKKLEIIQDALTTLVDAEPNPSRVDIKDFLKDELGDPPQAPIGAIDQKHSFDRVEELTFRLKKELLIAKRRLDEAKKAKVEAEQRAAALPEPSLEAKVAALRRARDYMIDWVEEELAKIPENDGDTSQADLSIMEDETKNTDDLSDEQVSVKIQDLYSVYMTARERLVASVETTSKTLHHTTASEYDTKSANLKSPTKSLNAPKQPIKASDILPYLRSMLQASREEASLLQQTSHLRRQLTLASEETDRTVQRLAGESYLVPQDTVKMDAWSKAADEASEKTKGFVNAQIQAGEESVENAKQALNKLKARSAAWESIKGEV